MTDMLAVFFGTFAVVLALVLGPMLVHVALCIVAQRFYRWRHARRMERPR